GHNAVCRLCLPSRDGRTAPSALPDVREITQPVEELTLEHQPPRQPFGLLAWFWFPRQLLFGGVFHCAVATSGPVKGSAVMTVAQSEEHPNKATTERFLEKWNLIFPAKSGVEGELERAVLHYGDSAPLNWLWPNRVPCGRVTLIEGPGGSGKSLVALD